jgi:NAD(P)-dependent dehydrogenase (short-subunit alcohol dehydrogenase family)
LDEGVCDWSEWVVDNTGRFSNKESFIGQEVALGLRRAGYQVYALVRTLEKGETLLNNERIAFYSNKITKIQSTSLLEIS